MSDSATEKTKSALKRGWWFALLLVFVGTIIVVTIMVARQPASWTLMTPSNSRYQLTIAASRPSTSPGTLYYLSAATTDQEQQRGLSGRASMPPNNGMAFVYSGMDTRCFWMKDMRFALDILWLNADQKVTHIETNVQPLSYPTQYCYVAKYVIELNAGEVAKSAIKTGQALSF